MSEWLSVQERGLSGCRWARPFGAPRHATASVGGASLAPVAARAGTGGNIWLVRRPRRAVREGSAASLSPTPQRRIRGIVIAAKTETAVYVPVEGLLDWIAQEDANAPLAENSRLRLPLAKSNTTTGMPAGLRRTDARSRSTGKERDSETGLDFMEARYFSGAQGRFTSPDEALLDQSPSDPQSWNLYGYARNNPLRNVDPTGRECVTVTDSDGNKHQGDDGMGGGCADAKVNQNGQAQSQVVTVGVGRDEANLVMLQGVGENLSSPRQWAEVARTGMEGAMAFEGLMALPSAIRSGFGLFQLWRATRLVPLSLDALAAAGGPTVEVVTSQTQALSAAKGLSTAIGEGASGVAKSFQPTGTLYKANIPQALVRALQSRGLAEVRSLPQGKELYFSPDAMPYVLRFFK